METSEEYIKMCDCDEIQGQWKPNLGDWILCKCDEEIAGTEIFFIGCQDDVEECEQTKTHDIWLPRQDQIQEMLEYEPHFGLNLKRFIGQSKVGFTSWEQLWLAFYMLEKHEKKWDGKEWSKE